MREQQLHLRVSRRTASQHPPESVEFLDEDAAQQRAEPVQPVHRFEWATRATVLGLVVAASVVWAVTRSSEVRPSVGAPPAVAHAAAAVPTTTPRLTYVLAAVVPTPVARVMSRALPGIAIRNVTTANGRWVDARYEHLAIAVDIALGQPSGRTTVQTVTSGASDVHLIHNRRPGARRTITITVVSPRHARIPIARLQRMADDLGRLPVVR